MTLVTYDDEFVLADCEGVVTSGVAEGWLSRLTPGLNLFDELPELTAPLRSLRRKAGKRSKRGEIFLESERIWLAVACSAAGYFIRDVTAEKHSHLSLKLQHSASQLLAEGLTLAEVAPRLLGLLGAELGWDVATLWERRNDQLTCVDHWKRKGIRDGAFESQTRSLDFARGEGLPGRVWASAAPVSLPDLKSSGFPLPRSHAAHYFSTACGVPVLARDEVCGVLELFSVKPRTDAEETTTTILALGHQLGNFMERMRLQRLREEDSRWYEAVLASIGDAVITSDARSAVTFMNGVAEELTGWTAEDAHGRPLSEVFPAEAPTGRGEVALTARDGGQRFVDAKLAPLRAEAAGGGQVLVFYDATERRATRRRLEESERNFRRLLETSREGILVLDERERISYVNGALCSMLGVTPEEMLGQPLSRLLEDGRPLAGQYERCFRRADGEPFWARVSAAPIVDDAGQTVGGFAMVTDITEARQQQESLRRSEARTRSLVEASSQAVWTANPEGVIQQSSASWRALTGQTEEEALGLGWLDAVHIEDRARVRAAWEKAVASATDFEQEFRIWSVQNRFLYLAARGVPVRAEDGPVIEWIVASTDVTERVEAQQELQFRMRLAAFQATVKDALAVEDDVISLLSRCTEAMLARLELCAAAVWLGEGYPLRVSVGGCWEPPARIEPGVGSLGQIVANQQAHFSNVLPQGLDIAGLDELYAQGVRGFVGHPVILDGHCLGVVAGMAERVISVNVMDAVKELAEGLASWVRRRRGEDEREALLAREQQARSEAETLLNLSSSLAGESSREALVSRVTDAATALTGAEFGAFFYNVVNEEGESFMLYSVSGVPKEAFSKFPMPRNTAVFSPTFHGEGTVRSGDITQDPRFGHNAPHHGLPPGHLPVRSYLAVSVTSLEGLVIGGLFFGHSQPDRFTERHAQLAESIASHAAFAFSRTV